MKVLLVAVNTDTYDFLPPLSVVTLAALTPEDVEFSAHWETFDGPFTTKKAVGFDIVGFTYYGTTSWDLDAKVCSWARELRTHSITTIMGGPVATAKPEVFRGSFDVVFVGEAEKTWPKFLEDYRAGSHEKEYRQVLPIDLSESPAPKWSVLSSARFVSYGMLQTTRGCPFDCEFCDVIQIVGRVPRHKTVEQIRTELAQLLPNIHAAWLCDDEFFSNRRWSKQVLNELIEHNKQRKQKISWMVQGTLNVAKDEELMALLADANVGRVMIGLESTTQEGLESINKRHNIRPDMSAEVKKVLRYGVGVLGLFIWGVDGEGSDCCQRVLDFGQRTGIPHSQCSILTATPRTKLWARLKKEGRLLDAAALKRRYEEFARNTKDDRIKETIHLHKPYELSDVIFNKASRVDLFQSIVDILPRMYDWDLWLERIRAWVSMVEYRPKIAPGDYTATIKRVMRHAKSLGQEAPAAQRAIDAALEYSQKHAEFLIPGVCEFAFLNAAASSSVPKTVEILRAAIAVESSWTDGDYKACLVDEPTHVPEAIEKAFAEDLFPAVYRRTFLNLADHSRLGEVLSEIFVDFITMVRGRGFDGDVSSEMRLLMDLCDRTCASFNGVKPEAFEPIAYSGQAVPNHRAGRIQDWVYRDIHNELTQLSVSTPSGLVTLRGASGIRVETSTGPSSSNVE